MDPMWPCLHYEAWPAFEANRKNTGAITGKSKTSICIACLVSDVKYVGNNSQFFFFQNPSLSVRFEQCKPEECEIGRV